jgi:hypothetical protein
MQRTDITKQLKSLRTITPRADWQAATRATLLARVRRDAPEAAPRLGTLDYLRLSFTAFRHQMLQPVVVMFVVFGTFLGSSILVNAAFYSLPGAPLYRVKLTLEQTHLAVTSSEDRQVELKIEFARKRVDELEQITHAAADTSPKRAKNVQLAVNELKRTIGDVQRHVDKLASQNASATSQDREKTLRVALTIQSQANELAKKLEQKAPVQLAATTEAGAEEDQKVEASIAEAQQAVAATSEAINHLLAVTATSSDSGVPTATTTSTPTETASTTAGEASVQAQTVPADPVPAVPVVR